MVEKQRYLSIKSDRNAHQTNLRFGAKKLDPGAEAEVMQLACGLNN